MSWFSKKNLPYWLVPVYFIAIFVVASHTKEYPWAKYGVLLLMAPVPIWFLVMFTLAYGEWLFNMLALWRADRDQFFNRMFLGLGKMFILLVFVGFFWALDPSNNWVLWVGVQAAFAIAVVSVGSFFAYVWRRRRKERERFRNIGKAMRAAAAEVRLKKSQLPPG
jgi:hypothetical protein